MNYPPFSLVNGSRVFVLVGVSNKEKKNTNTKLLLLILLPHIELVQYRVVFCSVYVYLYMLCVIRCIYKREHNI